MTTILTVANKLLSLRGRVFVCDEAQAPLYEARGRILTFLSHWSVTQGEKPVAEIKRKFSFRPTWIVTSHDPSQPSFEVRQKIFSWTRRHYLVGGGLDDVTLTGNFFDLKFEIRRGERLLARAAGKLLSLRDVHTVEVVDGQTVLVSLLMLTLQIDRSETRNDDD